MEITSTQSTRFTPKFFGKGSTYFGIIALNVILTVVTLGLYYPWAVAAYRKYIWNETQMKGSRFVFHGTGREIFKGFIIAYFILIGFYVSLMFSSQYEWGFIPLLVFYFLIIALMPFAIFGAWKYRLSRTSWRGIFFQFDGHFPEFFKLFLKHGFFTLITFGIYAPWMRVKLQKYLFSHTKLGNLELDFNGQGGDLFAINLVGILLSYLTLFLYFPVYLKDRFNFTIDHTTVSDGDIKKHLKSTLSGGEAWKVIMGNFLLLVFTLGLAFPWTFIRTMRMYFRNLQIPEDFDFEQLEQSTSQYKDATGDQMSDMLDFDFGF